MSVLKFIRRLFGYNQNNYDFGPEDKELEQAALEAKQKEAS
jgi:hypothetical protein